MVHNEMSFLFGAIPIPGTPSDTVRPMTNNMQGNTGDIYGYIDKNKYDRIFKDKSNAYRNNVISYIGDTIYASDRVGQDPYISLLNYFNGTGGIDGDNKHGPPSMKLQAADFVYLKDLGVYPINRLIILRRYRDGAVVPANLSLYKERPISTVIGWLKMDENNKELLSFNFGEKWVDQTDTLDKVIQKIMKEQFGIKTEMFMPIPGWSQGFLFGFLNNMGLSDYNSKNVPTGDPNVLRTSKMRDVESQSLMSEMKITFETSYEQKYIDGVDPGLAFQDILANLVRMGTSDMKFIIKGDSAIFQQFIGAVNQGGSGDLSVWTELGTKIINAFMANVKEFFMGIGEVAGDFSGVNKEVTANNTESASKQKQIDDINKKNAEYATRRDSVESQDAKNTYQGMIDKNNDRLKGLQGKPTVSSTGVLAGAQVGEDGYSKFSNMFTSAVQTVLAGSVYRYRWPLIGSIGVMSGIATTPWHLTVGNPFSPIINMNNIYVNNVDLKLSNEMGFNDMPKRVDVNIDIKMARPLGAQEINRMFNNQYGRIYSKKEQNPLSPSTPKVANAEDDVNDNGSGTSPNLNPVNPTATQIKQQAQIASEKSPAQRTPAERSLLEYQNGSKSESTNYQNPQKNLKINTPSQDQTNFAQNFFKKK